jgi:RHS repeat-associated protein
MSDRVYNYNVDRFLSVDPVIVDLTNTLTINPYSYVMNNPLSYTDPSGYSTEST